MGCKAGENCCINSNYCNRNGVLRILKSNRLVFFTLLGVLLGGCFGIILRQFNLPPELKIWIAIWGELFIRILKLTIIPLVMCSLIVGVSSLDIKSGGRLGLVTLGYLILINFVSILFGLMMSLIIQPGKYWLTTESNNEALVKASYNVTENNITAMHNRVSEEGTVNYSDIFADFLRNLFPDNIVRACLENVYTEREYIHVQGQNGTNVSYSTSKLVYRDGTNTMGIIIVSLIIGIAVSVSKEESAPILAVVQSALNLIFLILKVIIWCSPFAIASLVMSSVIEIEDLSAVLGAIGLYVLTFVLCCFFHMFGIMPLLYFIIVRRNPYSFFFHYVASGVIAGFGPPSSAVGVPVIMKNYKEAECVDNRIADFFLPLAMNVSRAGSAMFIMCAVMFVAQTYPEGISTANMIVAVLLITILAMAVSVVPSSSVMLVVTVTQTVNVVIGDRLAVLMAMEWILDRLRTCNNVTSSGLGCVIVEKICLPYLNKKEVEHSLDEKESLDLGEKMPLKDFKA